MKANKQVIYRAKLRDVDGLSLTVTKGILTVKVVSSYSGGITKRKKK